MAQKFRLINRDVRIRACEAIRDAPDKAEVTIREPSRTLDQNALLWAALTDVSRQKPQGRCHTPDVWKSLMMHACGYAIQFEMGLDGHPFPLGFRSSHLTIRQMRDLLDFIHSWGSQNGVIFTDPPAKGYAA